jgi:hypothetical protein
MGKMFFNILATFAEFEVDLLRMRTREGMAVARAKGRLRGRQPKLSIKQQAELRRMHATGDYSITDLADVFSVSRPRCTAPFSPSGQRHRVARPEADRHRRQTHSRLRLVTRLLPAPLLGFELKPRLKRINHTALYQHLPGRAGRTCGVPRPARSRTARAGQAGSTRGGRLAGPRRSHRRGVE